MTTSPPQIPKRSVRNIISIFENQTTSEPRGSIVPVRRAKSLYDIGAKPFVNERKVPSQNLELLQIQQQVEHLKNNLLNIYRSYSRDNHIKYQNEIIFILSDLATIEIRDNTDEVTKKAYLTEVLKGLNKKLNTLLPSNKTVENFEHQTKAFSTVDINSTENVVVTIPTPVKRQLSRAQSVNLKREIVKTKRSTNEAKTLTKKIEHEEINVDEVDPAPVSVKNLKQLFESNSTTHEKKLDFGRTNLQKKYLTFNSTADFKYIPYKEKYKKQNESETVENGVDIEETSVEEENQDHLLSSEFTSYIEQKESEIVETGVDIAEILVEEEIHDEKDNLSSSELRLNEDEK